MDLLKSTRCISSIFRPPPLIYHSPVAIAASLSKKPINVRKCSGICAASNSDTIVKSSEIINKKEDEHADLKSWMEKNGLPPCKVVLKERPSHDSNHPPIHYVAASEDLQVNSLHSLIIPIFNTSIERVVIFTQV